MSEPNNQGNDAPDTDETEQKYWDKLGKLIDERIDAGITRSVDKYTKSGQSRNGGRTTIPEIIAGIMWGPTKKDA